MKSLTQWLSLIEATHPTEIDMGLGRIKDVAQRLGLSFADSKVIAVAGTNGKGTTCRLIEQFCLQVGLRVGVYSSPHIQQFNERIRIEDSNVTDLQLCEAFESIEKARNSATSYSQCSALNNRNPKAKRTPNIPISLTYFEYATLAALLLFAKADLDVVILEVGLGGRLDATNIIDADINVVTSIALDHQDYLGDTLNEIAYEKMGIVKANKYTVVAYEDTYSSAEQYLAKQNNLVLRRGKDFEHSKQEKGYVGWVSFQSLKRVYHWQSESIPAQNVVSAIATITLLANLLDSDALVALLSSDVQAQNIIDNCHLAGRAQVLQTSPLVVLDVAHNLAASEYLYSKLEAFSYDTCHIVVGMLKDKNIEQCLLSFSDVKAHWYCASLPEPRGEQYPRLLNGLPQKNALSFAGFDSIDKALSCAVKQAANTDIILVFGSFISVAQATSFFNK